MTLEITGPGFALTQIDGGTQSAPALVALPGGGFFAVWTSTGSGDDGIRARIIRADGSAAGNEFAIAQDIVALGQPSVTVLSDGRMVVCWTSAADGTNDLRARIYSVDGASLSAEFTVGSAAEGQVGLNAVTALSNGGFVAVWAGGDPGTSTIRARLYSAEGVEGAEFKVASTPSVFEAQPTVVATQEGGFVVAWYHDSSERDIRLRVFDGAGQAPGTDILVNGWLSGVQSNPAMSVLADGSIIVVWQSLESGTNCVRARRLDSAGTPLGDDFSVSASPDNQSNPSVVALPGGGYAIAWEEVVGGDYSDVFLRLFDADGLSAAVATRVHQDATGQQLQPALCVLTDGRLSVAWEDGNGNGTILARVIDLRLRTAEGAVSVDGASFTPWLLSFGDVLTVAALARISVLNQHGLQTETLASPGSQVVVHGTIEVFADYGSFDAIRLLGTTTGLPDGIGGHIVDVAETGQIISHSGVAVRLAGGRNAITNAGLIEGLQAAILGGEGRDSIINLGQINGSVGLAGGDDVFDGRGGSVSGAVFGGAGNDLYLISDRGTVLVEQMGQGDDRVQSTASYTLGTNIEHLSLLGMLGLAGTGNSSANRISGNAGANRLAGGAGGDTLSGLAGADKLLGDTGVDRLSGGSGSDTLTGGTGADVFVFARRSDSLFTAADTIADFRTGQDMIDLSRLLPAKTTLVTDGDFTGNGPEVRAIATRKGIMLEVDIDGNGRADMAISLIGVVLITIEDFLF